MVRLLYPKKVLYSEMEKEILLPCLLTSVRDLDALLLPNYDLVSYNAYANTGPRDGG